MEELWRLIAILPRRFQTELEKRGDVHELMEIVLDLGRPAVARFPTTATALSNDTVTQEDLDSAISQLSEFGDDNRAGIDRTLHRISCLRNRDGKIFGLTLRVGRAIHGSATLVADLITKGCSILLLGRPGVGKSTSLRDCARILSEHGKRVIVVDTSNEIGGDGDIPHPSIATARRMQVPHTSQQHQTMVEAVENHMPEAIIIDEIGTAAEAAAARTIAQRGVQLVATAHGSELENLMKNPALSELLGGIESVTLGDEEARRRGVQKSVLERAGPPTFDVAIEMVERSAWRVHTHVGAAVDALLQGREAGDELRILDADGKVQLVRQSASMAPQSASAQAPIRPWQLPDAIDQTRNWEAQQSLPPSPSPSPAAAPAADAAARSAGERPASPPEDALGIFVHGIDDSVLQDVIGSLGLSQSLWITHQLADADAVLALRSKVKQGDPVRSAAKSEGVPIFALKSGGHSSLVRGIRALLGIDPSAGSMFDQPGGGGHAAASKPRSSVVSKAVAENQAEALEEVRLAVEEIVIPRSQPIELLPRSPSVIELQVAAVNKYGLGYEVAGGTLDARLRILPATVL